jgi:hypothetical protein
MDSRVFYLVCTSCDARAYTMGLAYAHEEEMRRQDNEDHGGWDVYLEGVDD